MKNPGFWNLPNILTIVRILLIPVVVWLLLEEPDQKQALIIAAIFIVAMLTDIIDGWLARKWDLVSPAGAYLDPLADKLMVTAVLIMLIPLGWAPAWLVLILLSREIAITGLRGIASQEGILLSAGTLGKIKTAYQSCSLSALLIHYDFFGIDAHSVGIIFLWIATFFSLLSGYQYLIQFFRESKRLTASRQNA